MSRNGKLSERYRTSIGLPITQAWGMTETSPLASFGGIRSTLSGAHEEMRAEPYGRIGGHARERITAATLHTNHELARRHGLTAPLVQVRYAA